MRKVKLELGAFNSFWFLGPIRLNKENKESVPIDVDKLTDRLVEIINFAATRGEVYIYDMKGNRVQNLDYPIVREVFTVSMEDIKDGEKELIPEVISVTVEEECEEDTPVTELDTKEAKRILGKNANTVKAMIRKMTSKDNQALLMACFEEEAGNKNRAGIIKELKNVLRQT